MNGLTHTESEVSEFVEVDPTGRYGRVCPFSFSLCVCVSLSPTNPPKVISFFSPLKF